MKVTKYIIGILILCACTLFFSAQEKKSKKNKKEKVVVAPVVDVAEGLNLGNKAPEIEMTDPVGQVIKLSSLKGKIVLIDFC